MKCLFIVGISLLYLTSTFLITLADDHWIKMLPERQVKPDTQTYLLRMINHHSRE